MKNTMTLREVSQYLRVSTLTTRRLLMKGTLKGSMVNHHTGWKITKVDLKKYLGKFN